MPERVSQAIEWASAKVQEKVFEAPSKVEFSTRDPEAERLCLPGWQERAVICRQDVKPV